MVDIRQFKTRQILAALLIVVAPLLYSHQVEASDLYSRRVIVGSSRPSAVTTYQFDFTIPSFSNLGSIEFEFCTNNPYIGTACTTPAGFDSSGVTLDSQIGETGFSVDGGLTTSSKVVLTRASVPSVGVPATYVLGNITNPSVVNQSVFVRIATYATVNASGPRTDTGAVVFATVNGIGVDGYVPPYLTFCVGVTVSLDCSTASGNILDFGELRPTQSRQVASELSGSTNDPGGYSVFLNGNTMTSGNNVITALGSPTASQPGTSQFGMNLRANNAPSVGADPIGSGTAVAAPQMSSQNQFYFNNIAILSSPLSTNFNKFTASYIVNVSAGQPPGIYSTTLTYVATAAF